MNIFPVIPGYRVEKKIGESQVADVYLGVQEHLEQRVVIKVLEPDLFQDKALAERFFKEAKKTGQFSHPNIATILEAGEANGTHYIVMEYLPESLRDRINHKFGIGEYKLLESAKIPEGYTFLHLLKEVAQALEYAHRQGFIHQDITPGNIRFREDGTAVVTGFFISNVIDSPETLKRKGIVFNSPYYISPEQALKKHPDSSSDIYSLGVVFYEMLTGRVPYDAEEPIAIENQHIMKPVPQLPESLSSYQELLERMMAKNKEERLASASQLLQTLDELIYNLPENGREAISELEIPREQRSPYREEQNQIKRKYKPIKGEGKMRMNIDKEELLRTLLNPRIALPVIAVVVIIVVLLVILSPSPDSAGGTPVAKQQALEEKDRQYQYKFQLAQRFFDSGNFQKAREKLKEAEQFKKTPETKELADKIALKISQKKDHNAFKKALADGAAAALEDYLKQFPSGLHVKEVEEKIAALKEEEKKREAEMQRLLASSIKLRSQYKDLAVAEVRAMLKKYGFYEKYYHESGDFKNHYQLKTIKNDPVVYDYATGLMWHQSGSPSYMGIIKAKLWVADLNKDQYAGYSDWRLPTLDEAVSLLENTVNRSGLYIDAVFSQEQRFIWTGDTFEKNKGWAIDFFGGDANKVNFSDVVYVRPVRSLK
ncbi:MAG: protein kinase [Candidatus Aminicenantes bacterium]|nr:protein kinase [Candidatus Aminicenantes bacterium]NIM79530.1 protein kinase [Candidatus Aminicenantes bacterium]NIN18844.1 protein kinase [Candidatus Aminicenantes bacterium]NIN42757.1 protein kinase [Candidatus Aminicenantes bacterium]NIN85484.1 protein kinase [Candidatus Aminicenantes bacterium]